MQGQSTKTIWRMPCHWDCQKRLPKEVCVTVAVPLGLSKKIAKTVDVPLGLSKEIAKRSLCNSRCAIGIVKKDCQKKSV